MGRVIQAVFQAALGCVRIGKETSQEFNISRGVLQGDIFSPVAFIAGLWKIFAAHDSPNAGITLGSDPHSVHVSSLEYADDAGLIDEDTSLASSRISSISKGSREDAAMIISIPKTKAMHVHPTVGVSKTTDEEITELNLKHHCPGCGRAFVNPHGMRVHFGRWCNGDPNFHSRTGSLADKAVQHSKRKAAESEQSN